MAEFWSSHPHHQDSHPLVSQSNTNLKTSVRGFCRCNSSSKSAGIKIWQSSEWTWLEEGAPTYGILLSVWRYERTRGKAHGTSSGPRQTARTQRPQSCNREELKCANTPRERAGRFFPRASEMKGGLITASNEHRKRILRTSLCR